MKNSSIKHSIEIISSGTEILQGLYPDTNAQWLSEKLDAKGYAIRYHHAVPDNFSDLTQLLRQVVERADLVLMTGGLGPTADDLTRQAIAEISGQELVFDKLAMDHIEARFLKRGRVSPESNRIQAMFPADATILYNEWGTAAGFILECAMNGHTRVIVTLPGPPGEMKPMFEQYLEPWLDQRFPLPYRQKRRVLQVIGKPESEIDSIIRDLYELDPQVYIGLRAQQGLVSIRMTARSNRRYQVDNLLDQFEARIRERIGTQDIFSASEQPLEEAVAELLCQRGLRVACAESCTGGMVSSLLTNVTGSSKYFGQSFITYSNESKISQLGVSQDTLWQHGAVSAAVAAQMAEGARRISGADLAVSITGIAGPAGGTKQKPVGLTWFGLADATGVSTTRAVFTGDRAHNRRVAALKALDLLRRRLLSEDFAEAAFDRQSS